MKTTDLWLATYIIGQGHPLADYKKLGHRKIEFIFNLAEAEAKELKLRYISSQFSKFEQEMNKLRELCYG